MRKCDLDAQAEALSPIPTRVVSNEEFIPPPQTPEEREFEARLTDLSDKAARQHASHQTETDDADRIAHAAFLKCAPRAMTRHARACQTIPPAIQRSFAAALGDSTEATIMINAAIVGLGRWGRNHVNAVAGSSRIRYTRAVTRNPAAAQDFAAQHSLALTTSLEEALADPAIDAVVLATPHSRHVDEVVAAAKAGKAVWCEKPLALTRAEAVRAVDTCRAAGVCPGRCSPGRPSMSPSR